jgi:hypothetical protein
MKFLDELLSLTEGAESPRQFVYWAGISAISAVLKKRVWLDKFYYKLYPNLYILLVAGSGGRKGYPISVACELAQGVGNTKIISGRSSIQAVITKLAMTQTKPDEAGPPIGAQGYIVTGEFASFLVDDPHAFRILTDLYDTHAHKGGWVNSLKTSGTETLKDPCISLFGGINPAHFKNQISDVDIEGGFIGRTLIIYSDSKSQVNSLVKAPERIPDFTDLINELRQISTLEGAFVYTEDAAQYFDQWYQAFGNIDHNDKTGTSDRIHDNILKVAIVLSASKRRTKQIELEDIQEAISVCMRLIKNVQRATVAQGKGSLSRPMNIVLTELINAKDNMISRIDLLKRNYGEFDAMELDRIVESLGQSGALKEDRRGKLLYYIMPEAIVNRYKEFKEAKAS